MEKLLKEIKQLEIESDIVLKKLQYVDVKEHGEYNSRSFALGYCHGTKKMIEKIEKHYENSKKNFIGVKIKNKETLDDFLKDGITEDEKNKMIKLLENEIISPDNELYEYLIKFNFLDKYFDEIYE